MYDRDYVYTQTITDSSVPETADRVREALANDGFGVLTEIDVQATLKKKLDIDRKPYLILGACNPKLAHQALEGEPPIGTLLPCNVTVFEGEDGNVYIQTPRPSHLFSIVGNPDVEPIASEVGERLQRVLENVGKQDATV